MARRVRATQVMSFKLIKQNSSSPGLSGRPNFAFQKSKMGGPHEAGHDE
jgi:hypothetical protein